MIPESPRILMVRLSSIGDLVHTLPVLSALRHTFPKATIDWLVEKRFRDVLLDNPELDAMVEVDTLGWRQRLLSPQTWEEIAKAVRCLRARRYDVVLDLQGTIKSSVAARLVKSKRRVGFDPSQLKEKPAALFYDERVSTNGERPHVIDRHLGLLKALGIDTMTREFPLVVPEALEREALRELEAIGLSDKGFVLLNPGGSWSTKRWSPEKFGALAAAIAKDHHLPSLVLWASGEEPIAERIVRSSEGAARLAPPTGIRELIPYARHARLFVSGDTGPMHLASAVGTTVVALFGPTEPARNGPFGDSDEVVSKEVPCGPCYKQRCPGYDNVCMTSIEVEEVLAAVGRRLAL